MIARLLLILLMGLSALLTANVGSAVAQAVVRVEPGSPMFAGEVQIPVNKSQVLRVDRPVTDILVGNPEIADVLALSDRSLYVLGKKLGSTSLGLYGANKQLLAVMDLTITPDLPTLRQRLFELLPNEPVEVRAANDAVVLSGTLTSPERLNRVLAVAENFAPGKVTNMLTLAGSQQVMLAVRFAEVQRTVAKQLGFNTDLLIGGGNDILALSSGVLPGLQPFAAAEGLLTAGNVTLDVILDVLERKGLVRTLAEPNLVAMSGETASFLAGGEFPIPVGIDEDDGDVELEVAFKEFGVKLGFTPTVVGDSIVNLVVEPEVSAIDPATSVAVEGLQIPGLTVRRAHTTVDLRHGESFAIAGLIQSNLSNAIQQFPGLADIPILGTLFRSTNFQREESELVIIVTPYLVRPAGPDELALPTDTLALPSEVELFLLGKIEGERPARAGTVSMQGIPPGAGLTGQYGYVYR